MIDLGTKKSVPRNTYVISNALPMYPPINNSSISIENGEYSINDGDFTSAPGYIDIGSSIKLKVLSSNANLDPVVCTLTVGGEVGQFTVLTVEVDGIPDFEVKDYLQIARSRYTEQFKNADVFDKFVDLITREQYVLQSVLKDLMQKRWLTTSAGAQLDNIGDIVGQPRDLFDSTIIYYFGFDQAVGSLSFGTLSDPQDGGFFKSLNDPEFGTRSLSDEEYRALIKIKILKNSTQGVINDFITMTRILYDVDEVIYTETNATITINIGRDFNDPDLSYFKGLDEITLAERYLPIPIGVRLEFDGTIL